MEKHKIFTGRKFSSVFLVCRKKLNLALDSNLVASGLKFSQFCINRVSSYSTFLPTFPLPPPTPRASGFRRVLLNIVDVRTGFTMNLGYLLSLLTFVEMWPILSDVELSLILKHLLLRFISHYDIISQVHMHHVFLDCISVSLWIHLVSQPVHDYPDMSKFSANLAADIGVYMMYEGCI